MPGHILKKFQGIGVVMISICAGAVDTEDGSIFMQTLAVFGLFIPQTLLAIFSTIGWSKASLKILFQHPSLILLPTFTFFTFAKMETGCGPQDLRIRFSKRFTFYNMVLSTIYNMAVIFFLYIPHMLSNGYLDMLSGAEQLNYDTNTIALVLIGASCGIIIMIGIVPTTIFLLYDKLCCCCCTCCLQPSQELVVFDPEAWDKGIAMGHGTGVRYKYIYT